MRPSGVGAEVASTLDGRAGAAAVEEGPPAARPPPTNSSACLLISADVSAARVPPGEASMRLPSPCMTMRPGWPTARSSAGDAGLG